MKRSLPRLLTSYECFSPVPVREIRIAKFLIAKIPDYVE